MPIQVQFACRILDSGLPATSAHEPGKPLGVERVVGQEIEAFPFHLAAAPAMDAPYFDVQVNARVGTGQVAYSPHLPVVPAGMHFATSATGRFFERRASVMTRACGSPKMPLTVFPGRNPGKAYASKRRFRVRKVAIRKACQVRNCLKIAAGQYQRA